MQILYIILIAISSDVHTSLYGGSEKKLANGWYFIIEEDRGIQLKLDKTDIYYYLDSIPIVVSKNIKEISFENGRDGHPYLKLQFDPTGTKAWKYATMRSINRRLGFVFENKLIQAPKVNSEIEIGIAAIWDYSKEELTFIKTTLENERSNAH